MPKVNLDADGEFDRDMPFEQTTLEPRPKRKQMRASRSLIWQVSLLQLFLFASGLYFVPVAWANMDEIWFPLVLTIIYIGGMLFGIYDIAQMLRARRRR